MTIRDPETRVELPVEVVRAALGSTLYKFFMGELAERDRIIEGLRSIIDTMPPAIQRMADGYPNPDANETNRAVPRYINDKPKEPEHGNTD